jgi:hypothetical protein
VSVRPGDDVEMAVGAVGAVGVVEAATEGVALPVMSEQGSSKQKLVSRFLVLGFLLWLLLAPSSSSRVRRIRYYSLSSQAQQTHYYCFAFGV